MKRILSVSNLKKNYHTKTEEIYALDSINFDVFEGEFVSIVGPSGCGKSTILSILSGLINKSDGTISVFNNYKFAYMLQEDSLLPYYNVLDNCLLGLRIRNSLNNNTRKYVIELLKKYGLSDFIYKYPDNLSGGMRQRCALIRTLAIKPDILLLDEAMSALDYNTRLNIGDDLYRIIEDKKYI